MKAIDYLVKMTDGHHHVYYDEAVKALEMARKEEREILQDYINKMADTLSNEMMWADGLTSGNFSHIAPAMKGAALRRLEQMIKKEIIDPDIYGPQLNDYK